MRNSEAEKILRKNKDIKFSCASCHCPLGETVGKYLFKDKLSQSEHIFILCKNCHELAEILSTELPKLDTETAVDFLMNMIKKASGELKREREAWVGMKRLQFLMEKKNE